MPAPTGHRTIPAAVLLIGATATALAAAYLPVLGAAVGALATLALIAAAELSGRNRAWVAAPERVQAVAR